MADEQMATVTVVDGCGSTTVPDHCVLPMAAWRKLGARLFGDDMKAWRWACPACGNKAALDDWLAAGRTEEDARLHIMQECVKRKAALARPRKAGERLRPDECDWCAYGLFAGPWLVLREDAVVVDGKVPRSACIPCFAFDGATEADVYAVLRETITA